jgi:hypothetical protein
MRERGWGEGLGDAGLANKTWHQGYSFTRSSSKINVDRIAQEGDVPQNGWAQFVLNESETLTQPGRVRINQSIRSYCWAILVAQEEAREPIIGCADAAQRRFVELIEQACVEMEGSSSRVQPAPALMLGIMKWCCRGPAASWISMLTRAYISHQAIEAKPSFQIGGSRCRTRRGVVGRGERVSLSPLGRGTTLSHSMWSSGYLDCSKPFILNNKNKWHNGNKLQISFES